MKTNQFMKLIVFFQTFLIILILVVPVFSASAQDYEIHYTQDQVTFQVTLHMKPELIVEFIVTIVCGVNDSMTAIIQNYQGSGPLWGFFLLPNTTYYKIKGNLDALLQYKKYADHASLYTAVDLYATPGPNVLAFYDTLGHPASDAYFNETFLKGFVGKTTTVLQPIGNDIILQPIADFLILVIIGISFAIIKKRFNIKFANIVRKYASSEKE